MGLFNYVEVDCPRCGSPVEFQSKSGSCSLVTYDINHMPAIEFEGIIGHGQVCYNCGYVIEIDGNVKTEFKDFSQFVN